MWEVSHGWRKSWEHEGVRKNDGSVTGKKHGQRCWKVGKSQKTVRKHDEKESNNGITVRKQNC